MSIGYATQKGLTNSNPMRRWSQQVSYTTPPTPAGNNRRTGTAANLTSLTFSASNGAAVTNSIYEFGGGSLDLYSNGRTIEYYGYNTSNTGAGTAPGGFPTGTGDFCIEGWFYKPSGRSSATGEVGGVDTGGGLMIRFGSGYNVGGINNIALFARGAADLDYAPYTWTADTWTHWAAQRKSGTVSFWANGNKLTKLGSGGGTYNFASSSNTTIVWGSYDPATGDEDLDGYLDELCVSNSWRYDDTQSTYNVPTSPFTVDQYTCMLFHFDSNLATAAT